MVLLGKIEAYLATSTNESPRNCKLIDRIHSIELASLEELSTDPRAEFPTGGDVAWWEVWLRRRDGREVERLKQFADRAGVDVGAQTLGFADRLVVLARERRTQLVRAVNVLDDVAELRRPQEPAGLIALEPAAGKADRVDQLAARTTVEAPTAPAACIVATGVHQAHPHLQGRFIAAEGPCGRPA